MNIRFLETFVWLCRLKNFNAVAVKLHTTQPSVSQRIATLEDILKQKLYIRGSKELELTPAGRHLLSYAERITDLCNEMQQELRIDEEQDLVVKVGIIEFVTLSWLPELVRLIRAREPSATMDFSSETTPALVSALANDDLDVVFALGPVNEPNVDNVHICSFPMYWLASPQHFDCDTEIDVVELARMPVILNRPGTSGYDLIREYFAAYGVSNVPNSPAPVSLNCSYSLATATQLVRTGLGIMAIPAFCMAEEIGRGSVRILPVTQALPSLDLTACIKSSANKAILRRIIAMAGQAAREYALKSGKAFCKT